MSKPLNDLWLDALAADEMIAEARSRAPLETGGVLIGYQAADRRATVVTDVIGPGIAARFERHRFIPDANYQEVEIARLYEQSGRLIAYLGDWHTHPGGSGELTRMDMRTLRRIARTRKARIPLPSMIVIYGEEPWQFRAWQWAPHQIAHVLVRAHVEPLGITLFSRG